MLIRDTSFKTWLEVTGKIHKNQKIAPQRDVPKYIFFDMDETLVHYIEVGWLKDCPGNKDYIPLLVHGHHPYPDVKEIYANGKDMFIFPRPRLEEFLEKCATFANCYILTHNDSDYAAKVVKEYKLSRFIKGFFTTANQEPNSLGKKFDLHNTRWTLVDNMKIDTVQMVQKFRILGLCNPSAKNPNDEARHIIKEGREHFVNVVPWYPTVDEHADNELFRSLPEIRNKLGIV